MAEFEAALTIHAEIPGSMGWLNVQSNLGLAFRYLATRVDGEAELDLLRRSVATLESAVSGWSWNTEPVDWAGASANLAMSEGLLAEKLADADLLARARARLDEAIAMFEHEGHAAGLAEARRFRAILAGGIAP